MTEQEKKEIFEVIEKTYNELERIQKLLQELAIKITQ